MKKTYVYIHIAEGQLKKEIEIIQSSIKKITGDLPFFSQWPPHMTLSYGNNLSEEEFKTVDEELNSVSLSTKIFQIVFEKGIFFTKKKLGDIEFYGIKLKALPSEELNNLSKSIIAIADKFETPMRGFFKSEFHLTVLTTPDINDEMFEKLKIQSNSWNINSLAILFNSFSIVDNGCIYKGYPTMGNEIKRFYLK